jgi:hypothetical protein
MQMWRGIWKKRAAIPETLNISAQGRNRPEMPDLSHEDQKLDQDASYEAS